jgi:hypothetical protein
MKFRGLIILAGLLFLAGCATLNKEECLSGDWRGLGMKDGVNGELAVRIEEHRKACAEHSIRPDEELYMAGRAEGLREYCQIDNAFQSGLKGRQYQGVCPLDIHTLFLRYNNAAYAVFKTRQEIKNKHDSISAAQNRLGNKKTSDRERIHIRGDIRKLESELDDLRNDLRDQERRLDEFMAEARKGKRKSKQETVSHTVPIGVQAPGMAAGVKSSAGTASGTLTIDGKGIPLKYAYAMSQPNTFDAAKNDLAVLLTEKSLPDGALNGIVDLRDATRNQHGYAYFKINNAGKPIYELIDHPATKEGKYSQIQMSGFTHAGFVPGRMGKDRVEGSFATSKPEDFMTYKYEINAEFSAPLLKAKLPEPLPSAKDGKKLPAGGGAPGKVYNAHRKAIRDKDIAALRRMAPDSETKDMSDSDLEKAIDFMNTISPATPKITRGYVKGDKAVLYVEGVLEGKKQYGTVELAAKGKTWFIVHENWSNKPPKK